MEILIRYLADQSVSFLIEVNVIHVKVEKSM